MTTHLFEMLFWNDNYIFHIKETKERQCISQWRLGIRLEPRTLKISTSRIYHISDHKETCTACTAFQITCSSARSQSTDITLIFRLRWSPRYMCGRSAHFLQSFWSNSDLDTPFGQSPSTRHTQRAANKLKTGTAPQTPPIPQINNSKKMQRRANSAWLCRSVTTGCCFFLFIYLV